MALSVDDFLKRVSILTGMSDASGGDDRFLLDQWINEGMSELFEKTQCVVTNVTVTLAAGVSEYELDRGVLTVQNYAQSITNPSSKITILNAADMIERRFLTGTGNVRYFCVFGGNLLVVSPTPDTDHVITFYAVPVPDVVSGADDIFVTGLPTYAQRGLECYMNSRAFEQARDYKNSQYWDSEKEKEYGKIRVTNRRQGGRTLPTARIGYPDAYSAPSRNDVYPRD